MEVLKGKNKFYIGEDEANPTAELSYKPQDENTVVADHTFVSEDLRGQGVAGKLFSAFVDFVRQENLKVVPVCSYVKTKMDRSSEFDDIRA